MAIQKITAAVLGNNAVTAANVAAGALSAADIADNSITAAKISASTSPTLGGLTVSGDLTVDTNTLYVNSSNNFVGIGTTTTTNFQGDSSKLGIYDSTRATLSIQAGGYTNPQNAEIFLSGGVGDGGTRTEGWYIRGAGTGSGGNVQTVLDIIQSRADTDIVAARFDTSGRLGLGETIPRKVLHVKGNEANAQVVEIEQADTAGIAGMHFSFNDAQIAHLGMAGASYTGNSDWTDRFFIGTISDKAVVISQYDTAAVIIDTNQNVGIGTTSPNANAKLDVNGVIRLYNASSNPTAVAGGIYYNTADGQVKVSNGTTWAPVGASVLPTAVSNLYSWWDLSGTYSTIGSGNSTVSDASGNGYTLTETGTVTTESFPSGKSGMRTGASGASNYFTSSAVPATTGARTLFAIIYNLKNTGVSYQHIMHYGSTTAYQAFGMAYTSGGNLQQHIWVGAGASVSYTAGRTGLAGVAVIFSTHDGSSVGRFRVYDAGGTTGVTTSNTYGSITTGSGYGIHVGGRISGSETGDVVIGECGAYSKELSESEMNSIATGLLARWT